jgi:hypothetical protein
MKAASSSRAAARSSTSQQIYNPSANLFLGRIHPFTARAPGEFDMIVFFGNASQGSVAQGLKIRMTIPYGLKLKSRSDVAYYYTGTTPAGDNIFYRNNVITVTGSELVIEPLDMQPHTMGAVRLTFSVAQNIQGNTIEDATLRVGSVNGPQRHAVRMVMGIQRDSIFNNPFDVVLAPLFNGFSHAIANLLRPANERFFSINSRSISIVGADFVHLLNGCVVIPLRGGRIAAIGQPTNLIAGVGSRLMGINDADAIRIAVAHSSVSSMEIRNIPTRNSGMVRMTPSSIVSGLATTGASNLVAAGGGNLVAAGGGNLVSFSLTGQRTYLVGNDGASLIPVSFRGPTLVAAGGGNMVAAGGGNMVAAGGGNLIGNDGSTLIGLDGGSLIGLDGGSLIGLDGGSFKFGTNNLIGNDGSTLVAAGGGNMVAAGGGNMVAAGGLNFSAQAASSVLSSTTAALQAAKLAGSGAMIDLPRVQFVNPASSAGGILSHNGGQILSQNGGVFIAK